MKISTSKKNNLVNFSKTNRILLFWIPLVFSFLMILIIKFSPLSRLHTSEIPTLAWFDYGEQLGDLMFNLSIGYIVSCIFYYFVVYIPEQKKRLTIMNIIQIKIDSITEMMVQTLNYFYFKYAIQTADQEEKNKVLGQLNDFPDNLMNFYYQQEREDGVIKLNTGIYTVPLRLEHERIRNQYIIDKILHMPLVNSIEPELIILLIQLRDCKLYQDAKLYYSLPENKDNETKVVSFPEFGKDLNNYYDLYSELTIYSNVRQHNFDQTAEDSWHDIHITTEGIKRKYKTHISKEKISD
ncbi:hypothetical protein [Paenibacillus sp. GCM10027626]|uniref:hypothetical protein n=1 Tax=Paenibacillus sp. GCM10027626 TaxID=3273411 RepID=UPI00362EE966